MIRICLIRDKLNKVFQTKSIALIFEPQLGVTRTSSRNVGPKVARIVPCRHLRGEGYEEYILRSQTRSFGGVSFELRGRISRQLFPYKLFPVLKRRARISKDSLCTEAWQPVASLNDVTPVSIPEDGNKLLTMALWTRSEKKTMEDVLRAWSRWEVNFSQGYVKSPQCQGTTNNRNEICDACQKTAKDTSFKAAIRKVRNSCHLSVNDVLTVVTNLRSQKLNEASLSTNDQRRILEQRTKYSSKTLVTLEAYVLQEKLKDPLIFDVHHLLERGDHTQCFLRLYEHARTGKLKNLDVFTDLCEVLADKVDCDSSGDPNAKYGIRYTQNYLNFMILVRSHGQNSAKQYGIIAAQFPSPSSRHLR